jgi:hypothetical protein
MHGATKDRTNPAFKATYATLASVIEAARGPLTENGIAFTQAPGLVTETNMLPIETVLWHGESGEWIKTTFAVPILKRDPQGFGSATTYGCRYSLMAALGLPAVDDDGEAAGKANALARPNGNGKHIKPTAAITEDNPFGLPPLEDSKRAYIADCHDKLKKMKAEGKTRVEVLVWWKDEARARHDFDFNQNEVNLFKSIIAEDWPEKAGAPA